MARALTQTEAKSDVATTCIILKLREEIINRTLFQTARRGALFLPIGAISAITLNSEHDKRHS
jgi:hypothetical protein